MCILCAIGIGTALHVQIELLYHICNGKSRDLHLSLIANVIATLSISLEMKSSEDLMSACNYQSTYQELGDI